METKKVLSLIFSLLFVGAFTFVLVWGITNFNKVQEGLSGTGLYTQEDLNKAYEDGYDTALTDKAEYEELINSYRDTITTLTDQVTLLTYANQDCETQIKNLTQTKQGLETQVANLTTIKNQNEATIVSLNAEIVSLQKQVKTLTESNEDKDEEIAVLKNQIANLQALISQLQTTNALNVETINSLNAQITNLNAQISDLTMQLQNNSSNVIALQNRIAELERTVAYYEQYIANLENGEQVVATFEFAGSVYNIQILAKNSIATVTTPTSTDYVIFNYWTVDGVQVDLSTYQVETNTRFVANVTYKYDVKFMVNNEEYDSQVVVKNGYPTLPANPVIEGYEFDGWTTNGIDIVKPNTSAVTMNTTYYAKLTKLHTVTFMYEDWVMETQQVRNGSYASAVSVENTNYKTFNGWLLNGAKVDLSTYKITGAETFVADIIYSYDVKFISDGATYNSQIIAKNNKVSIPNNPVKQGYEFDGWTLDGSNIINLTTYSITENTTFVAKFTKIHTVTFIHENNVISTQKIRNGEHANFVNIDAGYNIFDGWTINGNLVDVSTYAINEDTTFYSKITINTAELKREIFASSIPSKYDITNVVFDRYTSNNQYVVNGVNVISGLTPTPLNDDNTIQLYVKNMDIYVLSNMRIKIDTGNKFFQAFYSVQSITLNNFDTSEVTDMANMFSDCEVIETLDVSMLDTSNVTTMSSMFSHNDKMTSLNISNFDTSNVTNMHYMFASCDLLETLDVSHFNTSKVERFGGMFSSCPMLKFVDVSDFDTSSATDFGTMFGYCDSLNGIDVSNFDTSKATSLQLMFTDCKALTYIDVSNFDTSNVTNFSGMFQNCASLTSIDVSNFNTDKMTSVNYIFYGCSSLKTIDVTSFKTHNITDFRGIFASCPSLTTIYANDNFNTAKCTNDYNLFNGSKALVGAIAYDSSKLSIAYANYKTGYFTYKA